jgi:YbgC/YbaW family acyl-CoA thioester hydrolase
MQGRRRKGGAEAMDKAEKFSEKIKVRYAECDPTGYAYNANFFIWMGEAASVFFREAGVDLEKLVFGNHTFMAVHQSCDYMRPVTFNDIIEVTPVVDKVNDSSLHLRYEIYKGDILSAVGRTVHVYLDLKIQKKMSIPDELREKILKMKA